MRRSPGVIDTRDAGDALGLELGGARPRWIGVSASTSIRTRTCPSLVVREVERQHLPDRQAAEAHVGGAAEAGDVVEEDVVVGVLAVDLELGEPDEEAEAEQDATSVQAPIST